MKTELEKEKSRKDGGDSAWIERTRQTEAELDWAKEMADRLDRVNQGLSRENMRLKSQFKSQEDDRKFLIRQLVAVKVRGNTKIASIMHGRSLAISSQTSSTAPSLPVNMKRSLHLRGPDHEGNDARYAASDKSSSMMRSSAITTLDCILGRNEGQ